MKKILITGSSGFIGSNLIEFFLNKYEIFSLSRSIKKKIFNKNVKNVLYKDLNNFLNNNKIDFIIHTAAVSPNNKIKIENYVNSNIKLTKSLLDKCIIYKVKNFIFLSSLSINGESKKNFIDEKTDIINPSVYGISKLICENLIIENSNKINFSIIRLPGVIGKNSVRNWLTNTLKGIKKNKDITIFNPDHKFNNLIHVIDLCKFINNLIKLKILRNDILCISTKEKLKLKIIVSKLISLNNSRSKIIIEKTKIKSFYIKNNKILKNYNFKPMTTMETLTKFSKENV